MGANVSKPGGRGTYQIDFRNHRGQRFRLKAWGDRRPSVRLASDIEELVEIRVSGGSIGSDLMRRLEQLPPRMVKMFRDADILAPKILRGIPEDLEDWRLSILSRQTSIKQATIQLARVQRIFDEARIRTFGEIQATAIEQLLESMIDSRTKRALSTRTRNGYLQALQQFCKWMVRNQRASQNPISHLQPVPARRIESERERRAFTEDEFVRLIEAASLGPVIQRVPPGTRVALYLLSAKTGIRPVEVSRIRVAHCHLEDSPPWIDLPAGNTKSGKPAEPVLTAEVVDALLPLTRGRFGGAPLFDLPKSLRHADMIRADMKSAGIDPVDEGGLILDFYSLRHTFVTWLSLFEVAPAMGQHLARHSDPRLTFKTYTHLSRSAAAAALSRLPVVRASTETTASATGTESAVANECPKTCHDVQGTCSDSGVTSPISTPRSGLGTPRAGFKTTAFGRSATPPLGGRR